MEECNLWLRLMQQLRQSCLNFDDLWVKRRRIFNTQAMVKSLLHLASGSQQSYYRVMDQLDLGNDISPATSSFCEARAKMPSFIVGEVRRDILDVWDEFSDGRRWHGYRAHAIDGTKVSLPRPLFADGFKAPSNGHYPQGLVSLLVRVDDRMVCDIRLSKRENERHEAHEHLAYLSSSDLVIYDRGYISFALVVAHCRLGVKAIFRVPKGTSFLPLNKFWDSPKLDAIVTINPTSETYNNTGKLYPEYELGEIQLRLIKYQIAGETYVLATTILDKNINRQEFVSLYSQRWRAEETFKAYKQTLELETFHSKTEGGIKQEVESAALFWNLSRMLSSLAEPEIKKTIGVPIFIPISNQFSAEPIKSWA